LYFISDDKDFFSEINPDFFNSYLLSEWKENKHSNLFYYRRISEFFKDKFPKIKIASEYEKEINIKELGNRGSFAGARQTLRRIYKYEEFSSQQVNDFLESVMGNNQVF